MIVIACVDDNMGMMFNNRRISRDRAVIEHIIDLISGEKIWINNFSKDIFEGYNLDNLIADDNFLDKIEKEDYCFIENISLVGIENKVNKIIVYNWNRIYPADLYFNINLAGWILEKEVDFIGNSHDKITQKVYIRREGNE